MGSASCNLPTCDYQPLLSQRREDCGVQGLWQKLHLEKRWQSVKGLMQGCWEFIPRAILLICSRVQSGWPWTDCQTTATSYLNREKNRRPQLSPQPEQELRGDLTRRCPWIKYNQILVQTESGETGTSCVAHLLVLPGCTLVKNLAES